MSDRTLWEHSKMLPISKSGTTDLPKHNKTNTTPLSISNDNINTSTLLTTTITSTVTTTSLTSSSTVSDADPPLTQAVWAFIPGNSIVETLSIMLNTLKSCFAFCLSQISRRRICQSTLVLVLGFSFSSLFLWGWLHGGAQDPEGPEPGRG